MLQLYSINTGIIIIDKMPHIGNVLLRFSIYRQNIFLHWIDQYFFSLLSQGSAEDSSFLKAVHFFLTELATRELSAAESCFHLGKDSSRTSHFSPREIDQYSFSKCTIIVRLLEFTTMILIKGDQDFLKVLLDLRVLWFFFFFTLLIFFFLFTAFGKRNVCHSFFWACGHCGVWAFNCRLQRGRCGGHEKPSRSLCFCSEGPARLTISHTDRKKHFGKNLTTEVL